MSADRVQRITELIREGLGYEERDVTPKAQRALEVAAKELATVASEVLPGVLRNCRGLWAAVGETKPLYVSNITTVYPELARAYRKQQKRQERLEREHRENMAAFEGPASEFDAEHRAAVAAQIRKVWGLPEDATQ